MSHEEEDFKDTTSAIHLVLILVALVSMSLLNMIMGWFTILR